MTDAGQSELEDYAQAFEAPHREWMPRRGWCPEDAVYNRRQGHHVKAVKNEIQYWNAFRKAGPLYHNAVAKGAPIKPRRMGSGPHTSRYCKAAFIGATTITMRVGTVNNPASCVSNILSSLLTL